MREMAVDLVRKRLQGAAHRLPDCFQTVPGGSDLQRISNSAWFLVIAQHCRSIEAVAIPMQGSLFTLKRPLVVAAQRICGSFLPGHVPGTAFEAQDEQDVPGRIPEKANSIGAFGLVIKPDQGRESFGTR